jgi:muramoyltetrapeptide carboxypeptidase
MPRESLRIGVVAPGSPLDRDVAEEVGAVAAELWPGGAVELVFHPQCFLSCGHFAGDDAARTAAFLELANDPAFDAVWFGRGGYGACRLVEGVLAGLEPAAADKAYLGYSDAGTLLAALYSRGFPDVAHGPMPQDLRREGGREAVVRALSWLARRDPSALEPSVGAGAPAAAFNLTILSQLIGTPWQPDLSGHVLMLEEVSEYMYRIDRSLCHVTSNPQIRRVAGLRLGRCSDITENDRPFVLTEEEIAREWCARSGIPWLGRADIGHDAANKVVPFGRGGGR